MKIGQRCWLLLRYYIDRRNAERLKLDRFAHFEVLCQKNFFIFNLTKVDIYIYALLD